MTQVDNLIKYIPDLVSRNVLDVGCGEGAFVLDVLSRGGRVVAVEPHTGRVERLKKIILEKHYPGEVYEAGGENMPFLKNDSFGFINVCEVIEHVVEPEIVLNEVHRVLAKNGKVYISVPNRFGYYDWHFHLYFINWIPRFIAESIVTLLDHTLTPQNKEKQRLSDMHYMTKLGFTRLAREAGFILRDTRIIKISDKFKNPIIRLCAIIVYEIWSFFFLGNFHFILEKIDK